MDIGVKLLQARNEARVLRLDAGSTVERLIREAGLLPDAYIAVKGDRPLPTDHRLEDGDEIRLISVVSGG